MTCNRRYFYKYILGWQTEGLNIHLVFGEAWHRAMEYLLNEGVRMENLDGAYNTFLSHYREYFSEETDMDKMPKSPIVVPECLAMFIATNGHNRFEVLATEASGRVAVSNHREMFFRIDAILQTEQGIRLWDYKTTQVLSSTWREQFTLSLQFGTYIHAAHGLYPGSIIDGLTVKGLVVRKGGCALEDVPVTKTPEALLVYLYTVNDWISRLEDQWIKLVEAKESDDVLRAFPMNPAGCTKYNMICPYHNFCLAWPNPLQRCNQIPIGFDVKYWDPSNRDGV